MEPTTLVFDGPSKPRIPRICDLAPGTFFSLTLYPLTLFYKASETAFVQLRGIKGTPVTEMHVSTRGALDLSDVHVWGRAQFERAEG